VLARRCNEFSAELMQRHPGRFGGFACLPLPDVEGSLIEMTYGLDVLKLDGVVLFSNARGIYLGDRRFVPVFAELQRRAAVVFIHPTASPDGAFISSECPIPSWTFQRIRPGRSPTCITAIRSREPRQ
jgi:aminocarboxymuconate-semialdehyde decarboxylase